MLNTTLSRLRCPRTKGKSRCRATLSLFPNKTLKTGSSPDVFEVVSGRLECTRCKASFPILAGVAILVDDIRLYLLSHVKGIAQVVPDSEIPREYLREYREAKAEIQTEHIEEDLEAERIISLYLMTHYLHAGSPGSPGSPGSNETWFKPRSGAGSPLIEKLIREYWDQGPFARIGAWIEKSAQTAQTKPLGNVIEVGCGVGGLYRVLKSHCPGSFTYLGVDSSFASIALARHLTVGTPYRGSIRIPKDLLQGPVSEEVKIDTPDSYDGSVDFVAGEIETLPVVQGEWDLAIALNAIDMLPEPALLPRLQYELLKTDGRAIQSCPYIWHASVARSLRKRLPKDISDSAAAVEWLYREAGFEIEEKQDHVPWLFFKHLRQLEIYSVHLFIARR